MVAVLGWLERRRARRARLAALEGRGRISIAIARLEEEVRRQSELEELELSGGAPEELSDPGEVDRSSIPG